MQNKTQNDAAAAPSAAASAAPSASTGGVPDGFQKVDDAAPQMQSGEALLVEAYAFIWVVLFALVLFTWLRQRGLDARMNELEASIARARNPRPSKDAGPKKAAGDGAEKAD